MTAEEIIRLARLQLDDTQPPYLWEDIELVAYLNDAINDLCRDSKCIIDSATSAVCQLKILANQAEYTLDSRVIWIKSARISSKTTPLTKKTELWMDTYISNWREDYCDYPEGIASYVPAAQLGSTQTIRIFPYVYDETGYIAGSSNISFAAATKYITKAGATFTDHFEVGDEICVSGTTSNNGYFTLADVQDTQLTVNETLVDEASTSAILRRVEDTMTLTVARYPTSQILLNALTAEPEISFAYHRKLVDGILMYAYEKDDADTYNQQKADRARVRFAKTTADIKKDIIQRYHAEGSVDYHDGAM